MLVDSHGGDSAHEGITSDLVVANNNEMFVVKGATTLIDRQRPVGGDATMQVVSPALHEMPSDIQALIFTALPFRAFVCLLRVCRAWNGPGLMDRLSGGKIKEMGRAAIGRDIMTALRRSSVEAAMPPEWEAALLLCFASKVEHVALSDRVHHTHAWMARLHALKDSVSGSYSPAISGEIDALHWFVQSTQRR
jgi:hypothetical protein